MNSLPPTRHATLFAATIVVAHLACSPTALAQANSTNIAGSGNIMLGTASSAATIAGNTSTNGGTNSAIIGAANSIVPGGTRFAFIGAGNFNNMAAGSHSAAMVGGFANTISSGAARAVTLGGGFNTNAGRSAVILGGEYNTIGVNSTGAAVIGGLANLITANSVGSSIGGGNYNTVFATNIFNLYPCIATIAGGGSNSISPAGGGAVIGGGAQNTNGALFAVIAGGYSNTISIANPDPNAEDGGWSGVIGGGEQNKISGKFGVIGGGYNNEINGYGATIGGGDANRIPSAGTGPSLYSYATIGGGYGNIAGPYSAIPGGVENETAEDSFAAGNMAKATNRGSFVWNCNYDEPTSSWGDNTFTARCYGGARFYASAGTNSGAVLGPGSGSWTSLSDRNAKENFEKIDGRDILSKLASLPVMSWNYKAQAAGIRHLGPTAQDFKQAFGIGESDTGITTVDADGVALAAIQGLIEELKERDKAIEDLKKKSAEVDELKAKLQAVEDRLNSLPPAP